MAKYSVLMLATLCACIYTFAASPADTVIHLPQKQSLLWKISGKDLKKPSYLFGTIHLLCPQDYVWTPAMRRSLQQCDQVCFEMDMDDPKVMMDIGMGMIDNSGKTLKDYFTQAQYDSLSRYFTDSLSMNINMLQQVKPAALISMFAMKVAECDNPVSYESKIQDEAKKYRKDITGLEEPYEQIALLDSIPPDSIVVEVMEVIAGRGEEQDSYKELITAYKKQNLSALDSLINHASEHGSDITMFLDERNIKWIDRMEEQMEQKAVFFAVGAGHLWNENGLVSLLQKAGYTVQAIK